MRTRTLICTTAGLLAVGLLMIATPKEVLLPKGIARPAEKIFPAIAPEKVSIYPKLPTENALVLGHISIEQGFDTLTEASKEMLIEKIKMLAAGLGANGVVVNVMMPVNGIRQMILFRGTAIFVPSTAGSKA